MPSASDFDAGATRRAIQEYAAEAEATGWFGPEILFGLAYKYVRAGQSILDIGIGTGLSSALFRQAGLHVRGMDLSPEMLAACRSQGIRDLVQHDLLKAPYPFERGSADHAVCTGVFNFFPDLSVPFNEAGRILRDKGIFACVVGDRSESEAAEFLVGCEHTHTDEPVTMYRHSAEQIGAWAARAGLATLRSLPFEVYIDRHKSRAMRAQAYLLIK